MIQNVDTYKVMKEIHIAMKPVLPLLPNFVYDIKQVLWEEIDINICDTISESIYKKISK